MLSLTSKVTEAEEYMASLYQPTSTDQSPPSSSSSSSDSDEIEIVQEVKVSLDEHRCDLCTRGAFLVTKLSQFAGIRDKYTCDVCFKGFKWKSHAQKHAATHLEETSKEEGWSCPLCPFHTLSETGFKRHTTNQHKAPHTCGQCGLTYKSEKSFLKHCSALHPQSPDKTVQRPTDKTVQRPTDKTLKAPGKTKKCKTCRKSFLYEKSFNEHVCHVT